MNEKKLFTEFPPISTEQWESVIQKDLKGADYERKLVRKTLDGINIRPYYRNEHLQELKHLTDANPGEFPFVRGNRNTNDWLIRQDILVDDFKSGNAQAFEALKKGAESVCFVVKNMPDVTASDLNELLAGLPFGEFELNFSAGKLTRKLLALLGEYATSKQIDTSKMNGSFSYDPLGCLTITGSFCESGLDGNTLFSKELFEQQMAFVPEFQLITVHANYIKNAGSTIVQELACALAMGTDYIESGVSMGLSINDLAPGIRFNFAVGSEYFMEIAKLRAARYLWAKIVEAYEPCCADKAKMKINSVTAEYNQTIYDPYVNMLRSTTEAMSAVIGGTNSLTVLPFNIQFDKANPFSERIARNQQILLKKESYLDKVADPSAGSYFIETLTNSIVDAAWSLFVEIQEKGGYFKAFKQGFIQEIIAKSAQKRDFNISSRQEILLGTNQYPNFKERAKESIKINSKKAGSLASCEDKIAEPIRVYRGAEAFEELRLATENSGKTPRVFLFTIGNLAMRKARAAFATNFFACAGFEVDDNNGFASVKDGIDAAIQSKAEIVVICSSDEEYPVISKEIVDGLKGKIVVIAGYPKESIEQLQSFGIKYFIHIKSNVLDTLKSFQKDLNIG